MKKGDMEPQNDENIVDLSDLVAAGGGGDEPQVYEIGYHLVSTMSEDAIAPEAEKINKFVASLGGTAVGERAPLKIDLAYPIDKKIGGTRERFMTAYFGWTAFELLPGKIMEVKTMLDDNASILRFIILKTDKNTVAAALADPAADVMISVPREPEAGGVVSEEALDSALKHIEAEDKKEAEVA